MWGKYRDPPPRSCCSEAKGLHPRRHKKSTSGRQEAPGGHAQTRGRRGQTAELGPLFRVQQGRCRPGCAFHGLSHPRSRSAVGRKQLILLSYCPANRSLMPSLPHSLSPQRRTTPGRLRSEQRSIVGGTALTRHHQKAECGPGRYFERQERPEPHKFYYSVLL